MIIPNYELIEKIAEGKETVIYRAYHKKDPQRLLALKVLKTALLSDYKISQFSQRIERLKVLNNPLVITPTTFNIKDGFYFISQDWFDGIPLDDLQAHSMVALKDFFTIACRLAEAIDKIHEAGIIHGGIKPHNILVNPDTLDIRLTDFISTVDVRDVSHFIYEHSFVKDTLAYTSPEQTGRINHRVVFSSDLYSLGAVFYKMLTGYLPFSSDDPLELIHSHLAEEASDVHQLNADVPFALSKIIARLLLKAPEKRYQSANGLLADLIRCRDEYDATGAIGEFPLENSVCTRRVTFISKMVGRDREAGIILEEYEQAAEGAFRSLFLSGLSGIGKTRLIQELQKPIVMHRGYFTSGKFDVYQKNIPYSSLIQAFRNLMRVFLTESDERVALWKRRILNSVGQNGSVLTDVIPELEVLIGPQPEVKPLPPVESLNRFHDLFERFLACLESKENPLTLFIDDLQWCDAASLDFLTNIFANYQDHPYLFLLGAYRHNEVDASHPLARLIQSAREGNRPLQEIRLGPLQPQHCQEMVSYILDAPLAQTKALSDFIGMLSEGNPLFVSESLSYLHHEDLLFLDEERQWRWDMEKVRQSDMPNTVVALFDFKIQKLPPDLVNLLEFCACMGNAFSPADISLIREMPLLEIFEMLKPALGQGLLMENKNRLQFIHDKVQEATLSKITAARRRQIHRQIGNHLLRTIPEGAREIEKLDNLFAIVAHLNLGREEIRDSRTAYLFSDLNYHAGNKAFDSLAADAANEYFRLSRELLPVDCWDDGHYERTFRIFQKAAKTELMCGNYEGSERLLAELLEHAGTDLDKTECLAEQTTSLSSIGNFIKAIETANRGLAYFGKAIPDNPGEANRQRQDLMAEISDQRINVWETILNMPFTTDRRSKIELAFYSELIPDLYMSGLVPQLYLSAAQSTRHCLAGGMDESVIYSFSIMGLQLGEQEEFQQAFRYEDLACNLSAKYPNTFGATRGMNGIVWCNMHSRSHPREIVDYCRRSIQCGKNCGDLYNAGLSYGPLMWNLQVQGADLSVIEDCARECLQFSNRYHLSFSTGLAEAMRAGWIAPMKKDYAPILMEEQLKRWERDNHIASAGSYCVHMGLAHYYFGEHEQAQVYLDEVRRYLSGLTDNVLKRQWHVFLILNALKMYERGQGFKNEDELLAEIRPIIKKVEQWAALGPLLKPYLAFLYAELERVTGSFREARSLYLDAINSAHEQKYIFLEGHLHECLGEMLLNEAQCSERVYFAEAGRLYKKCHAERKEIDLIERHPDYFEGEKPSGSHFEVESGDRTLPDLDVEYLMRSSLAISAEIERDTLLKKIMNIVIESSGAQHGYLLIAEDGALMIRAESHIGERQARAVNQNLDDAAGICKAIVRYVYRTGERALLDNALQEGMFKDNPEVQDLQLRSVLCLPVVKLSRMIGILYLENRLSDGVFTSGKTQMTELLTSQAAISLQNSRLMEELLMAKQEWERTFDAVPDLIAILDTEHRIIRANRSMAQRLGRQPEQCAGLPCFQCVHDLEKPPSFCPHVLTLADGKQHVAELHEDKLGGEFLVSTTPLSDQQGNTIGAVHVARDITERKKVELALRKSHEELEYRVGKRTSELVKLNQALRVEIEERKRAEKSVAAERKRFNDVLELLPAYLVLLTPDYHVSFANRFFRERFGESHGRRCFEYLFERNEPCDNCETHKVLKTNAPHHWEWTGPDGRNYDIYDFPFTDVDGSNLIMEMGIDITERKKAEEALRKLNIDLKRYTEELSNANKELESFNYSVSHDLRAPLRSINGFSQIISNEYQDKLGEEGREYLQIICTECKRMGDLIDDLLDLSRLSRKEIRREEVDLSSMVETITGDLRRMEPSRPVDFVIASGIKAYGDKVLLQSVLENLVNNAWKFTSKHPQARIEFGVTDHDGNRAYFVRDDGAGYDMKYAHKLFGAFQRLHGMDEFPGNGIGLAIIQRIIHRHGGQVWADGAIEKGAAFFFTLEAETEEESKK